MPRSGRRASPSGARYWPGEGLPSGLTAIQTLPGIVDEERLAPDGCALGFLRRMKSVGGLTPRDGYRPLSPGALRRAIRAADAQGGRITWHIVYGRGVVGKAKRAHGHGQRASRAHPTSSVEPSISPA